MDLDNKDKKTRSLLFYEAITTTQSMVLSGNWVTQWLMLWQVWLILFEQVFIFAYFGLYRLSLQLDNEKGWLYF